MGNRPNKMDDVLNKIEKDGENDVKKVQIQADTKWTRGSKIVIPKIPLPECPEIPRFEVGSQDGLDYLEEHGYVVFQNVLTPEEIEHAKDLCWKWIEALPYRTWEGQPLRRDNPSTWISEAWPGDIRNGLVNSDGAGQSDLVWYVRGIPQVKKAFAGVWGTDKLLVSFDGFSMFRPWSFNPTWKTAGGWYHTDQNANTKPGKQCVQGIVTLYDVDERTGGLTVIPDSHKQHEQLAEDMDLSHGYDFVMIPRRHDLLKKPGIIMRAKAGDLLLWDSRTIHCNSPALKTPRVPKSMKNNPKELNSDEQKTENDSASKEDDGKSDGERYEYTDSENWELLRIAMYICMTPKHKVNIDEYEHIMERRKWAVENFVGTTHWPHEFHIHGGHGGKGGKGERDLSQFNEQQLSLIGATED